MKRRLTDAHTPLDRRSFLLQGSIRGSCSRQEATPVAGRRGSTEGGFMTLRSHLIGDPLARAGVALGQLATDDAVVELPRYRERGPSSGRAAAIIAGQA